MGSGTVRRRPRRAAGLHQGVAPVGGQAVVEFALVSLVLFMLVFGTIDFGRLVYQRAALTNAIREAAHVGAVEATDPTINLSTFNNHMTAAARNRSPGLGSMTIIATCYSWNGTTWVAYANCKSVGIKPGDRMQVTATYNLIPVATKLVRLPTIAVNESADVFVQ